MKKNVLILLIIMIACLVLSSCSTSMSVQYNEPSLVNMGAYRKVAIASAVPCKTVSSSPFYIRLDLLNPTLFPYAFLTSYSTSSLEDVSATSWGNAVNSVFAQSSYYDKPLDNKTTDSILALSKIGKDPSKQLVESGYTAVIIPRVDSLRADEYISSETVIDKNSGEKKVRYIMNRSISMAMTITVLDTTQNKIAYVRTYNASESSWDYFNPDDIVSFFYWGTTHEDLIRECVSDVIDQVNRDFRPKTRTSSISLMSNKPKIESLKDAYKAADDGNFRFAYNMFLTCYQETSHIPSGYNAALILASSGDLEGAIALLSDMRRSINNSDVNRLYSSLVEIKRKDDEARAQMTENNPATIPESSIYDYLLK